MERSDTDTFESIGSIALRVLADVRDRVDGSNVVRFEKRAQLNRRADQRSYNSRKRSVTLASKRL